MVIKYILILSFVLSCSTCYETTINYVDSFSINLYRRVNTKNYESLINVNLSEIDCIDWEHQAYRLSDSIITLIDEEIKKWTSPYYFSVEKNGIEFAKVGVTRALCSNGFDRSKYGIVYYSDERQSLFRDSWLTILCVYPSYLDSTNTKYYNELFNDSVFDDLKSKGYLNGRNWKCCDRSIVELNKPDMNLFMSYKKRWEEM